MKAVTRRLTTRFEGRIHASAWWFFEILTVKKNAMTKADLIKEVAHATKMPQEESEVILGAIGGDI
jgi:hypothetical protein